MQNNSITAPNESWANAFKIEGNAIVNFIDNHVTASGSWASAVDVRNSKLDISGGNTFNSTGNNSATIKASNGSTVNITGSNQFISSGSNSSSISSNSSIINIGGINIISTTERNESSSESIAVSASGKNGTINFLEDSSTTITAIGASTYALRVSNIGGTGHINFQKGSKTVVTKAGTGIKVDGYITIENGALLEIQDTTYSGIDMGGPGSEQQLTVNGSLNVTSSGGQGIRFLNDANRIDINGGSLSVTTTKENASALDGNNFKGVISVNSGTLDVNGGMKGYVGTIELTNNSNASFTNLKLEEKGKLLSDKSIVQAETVNNSASIELKESAGDFGTVNVTDTGKITVKSGEINIENLDTQGQINFENTNVQAQTIVMNDESSISVTGGELSTSKWNNNGTGKVNLKETNLSINGDESSVSQMGIVDSSDSTLKLAAGSYEFAALNGSGNTVVLTDLKATEKVTVADRTDEIAVKVTSASNDQYSNAQAAAQAVSEKVSFSTLSGDEKVDTLTIEASDVNNSLTAKLDESGNLYDIVETRNPTLDALSSITVLTGLQWRHEMNELGKRMGDLRLTPEGIGSWARLYGSEQEYGAAGVTQKNTSLQVGFDTSVGSGWIIGAALSYTDGSAKYAQGESDNKGYGLALYGTWMDQSGLYVDLIGKYSRLDTDYKVGSMSGDFDNNAYSLSAEVGWRFDFMNTFFVEPQVEFTYGTIVGEDYQTSNRVAISQDDFDTLTGRVGFRAGLMFPENKGNVYLRASVLHEWEGEMTTHANKGVSGNTIVDDIGGTYYEFGVGGNFRLNESTAAYVDLEKNCSGEVKENWRWNVGLRYVF